MSAKTSLKRALALIDDAVTALRRVRNTGDSVAASQIRRAMRELDDAESKIKQALRDLPED